MKILIFLLMITSISNAQTPDYGKWSLSFLAKSSNSLLVISDQILNNEKPICPQAKPDDLMFMQQKLKSLIDEKIQNLNSKQSEKAITLIEGCESDCSCDILSLYFENFPQKISATQTAQLNKKASIVTSEQRLNCATNFKDFCKSALFKFLRKKD